MSRPHPDTIALLKLALLVAAIVAGVASAVVVYDAKSRQSQQNECLERVFETIREHPDASGVYTCPW